MTRPRCSDDIAQAPHPGDSPNPDVTNPVSHHAACANMVSTPTHEHPNRPTVTGRWRPSAAQHVGDQMRCAVPFGPVLTAVSNSSMTPRNGRMPDLTGSRHRSLGQHELDEAYAPE